VILLFCTRILPIQITRRVLREVVYKLPEGMRYATLGERGEFYRKEFDLKKVKGWFSCTGRRKTVFAVVIGRHTRIFPEKYRDDASTTILIDEYTGLKDVKRQLLDFLPEGVYYDRNIYDEAGVVAGQEIAFDLDPENFTCSVHGTLMEKMNRHQGLSFCKIELRMVKKETVRLYEELERQFSSLQIVYSGRGFHIHLFDVDTFVWSYQKKKRFARELKKKGFVIDEWVTTGGMRLIRLPYSLHGMVSRIVMPLEVDEVLSFDPVNDRRCIPRFLHVTS
jgi:DNA primase catalytic subunit